MRFDYLKAHNLGPFRDVELDFEAIEGRLIAVCGDNGQGKSTLLELLPAALYRSCPTRGSLTDLATARDALLEVRVQNGHPYTIVQHADRVGRKGESEVLRDGRSLLQSASVRAADAWVADHFPAAEVLYNSAFLAQGSQGFIDLSPGERKRVLLRLLQIEKLEALSERARERGRDAKGAWRLACERERDARNSHPDLAQAQRNADSARAALEAAKHAVGELRVELALAKSHEPQRLAARERNIARQGLLKQLPPLRDQRQDVAERIANNERLLADAASIQEAQASAARLQQHQELLHEETSRAKAQQAVCQERAGAAEAARTSAREACDAALARCERTREQQRKLRAAERAATELPALRTAHQQAVKQLQTLHADLQSAQDSLQNQAGHRIEGLRGGLVRIASNPGKTSTRALRVATTTLAADDQALQLHEQLPRRITSLKREIVEQTRCVDKAAAAYDRTRELAAGAAEVKAAATRLAEQMAEAEQLESAQSRADEAFLVAQGALKRARKAVAATAQAQQTLTVQREALAPKLALVDKLAAARTRLDELQRQAAQLDQHIANIDGQLQQLPELTAPQGRDPSAVQQALDTSLTAEHNADLACVQALATLQRAQEGARVIAERQAEAANAEADMRDYDRLGRDLGKDGLQALEIDAALPELTALTNDLLHACHGARFTVELSTTSLSSDGKKTLESLDVRVIDTVRGRDALAETYSGGEQVIVSEALSLALTMLACRRAGLVRPTLVRDESGAWLDAENGRAYIAMLRRAAEIVDADKVLFVSHSRELWTLADARIVVDNGSATVEVP